MAAGLVAYPFGLVLGAVGIVRPDVKRSPPASPSQVLPFESTIVGPRMLILASSSQGLPLSP